MAPSKSKSLFLEPTVLQSSTSVAMAGVFIINVCNNKNNNDYGTDEHACENNKHEPS